MKQTSTTDAAALDRRQPSLSPTPLLRARRVVPILALLFLVFLFIPHQLAFLTLYLIQFWLTLSIPTIRSIPNQGAVFESTLVLLTVLLPLNAPILLIYARAPWRSLASPFGGDHNALQVLGVVLLVEVCGSGRTLGEDRRRRLKWPLRAVEVGFYGLAGLYWSCGGRWLWVGSEGANVVLGSLAAVMAAGVEDDA